MDFCGLILARKSSKSIPDKNIKKLSGKPLINWVLEPMIESKIFDEIWISTDDRRIADVVNQHQVNVHWRSHSSASDDASSLSAIKEFLWHRQTADILCLVQCTSPFLDSEDLKKASQMLVNEKLDSVFSVVRSHHLRWSRNLKPLNFDPTKRPRRQDWEGELVESGHFYFFKKRLIEENMLQGGRCGVVELSKRMCIEIDEEEDWEIAELMAKKFTKNFDDSK